VRYHNTTSSRRASIYDNTRDTFIETSQYLTFSNYLKLFPNRDVTMFNVMKILPLRRILLLIYNNKRFIDSLFDSLR